MPLPKKEQIKLQYRATKIKQQIINAQCKSTCGNDKYPSCGNRLCRVFMVCQDIDDAKRAIEDGKTHIQNGKFIEQEVVSNG